VRFHISDMPPYRILADVQQRVRLFAANLIIVLPGPKSNPTVVLHRLSYNGIILLTTIMIHKDWLK
jgi:hypothetical protein